MAHNTPAVLNEAIVEAILSLDTLAVENGFGNIFQPGLAKEILMARALNHRLLPGKRGADAESPDGSEKYEYLSASEGNTCQISRVYSRPVEKMERCLERVLRNAAFFMCYTSRARSLDLLRIYRVEMPVVLKEVKRQISRMPIDASQVCFPETWVKENGNLFWEKPGTKSTL